ncbi:hypothetical protein CHUAL_010985 [Chamberlinius hualienensis]
MICRYLIVIVIVTVTTSQELPRKSTLSPIVKVNEGLLQGTVKTTLANRPFYAFKGIPFGKSPTGPLRFKAPQPVEKWEGIQPAVSDPPLCIQIIPPKCEVGEEDCLKLNVYTPKLSNSTFKPSLPVVVYIQGGGYYGGNINYDPEHFINSDIVLALMNYRITAFGFLSTNDDVAPGNAGLLDQNLAMKWIRDNIAAFGGNPNNITLMGLSSGASSALLHMISPLSSGLFQKVIAQSGSPLSPWSIQKNPLYYAKKLGQYCNCPTYSTTALVRCLQNVNARKLAKKALNLSVQERSLAFVPIVETSPRGVFLTEDPYILLKAGNFNQVPLQLGFDRDEGAIVFLDVFFTVITDYTFSVVVPTILDFFNYDEFNVINVAYAIKAKYYANVNYFNQTAKNIATIKWISDAAMKSGIAKTAALVSSHNVPTYFYAYNYASSTSDTSFTGKPDVSHTDETRYIWTITDNSKDADFRRRFWKLWTDFIFTGKHLPSAGKTATWLPTPPGQYHFYDIQDTFTMRGNYDPEAMQFWWNVVPTIPKDKTNVPFDELNIFKTMVLNYILKIIHFVKCHVFNA